MGVVRVFGNDNETGLFFVGKSNAHRCDKCGKSYKHQATLWNHRNFTCKENASQFDCGHCAFSSKYAHSLQQHAFSRHNITLSRGEIMKSFKEKSDLFTC
ncbi:unnamed protein product [Phyllotreta striolata]|uniref:C2H2-type domain-containing protein n=1 Tax=Phyllotreta striolata TaxID=444603 RepID=A0A9N9TW56_PHYSR|nr:unnamed protein product [Phyllotreta striolata]